MGRPLFYEIMDKPTTSFVIALRSLVWFYIHRVGLLPCRDELPGRRRRTLLEDCHVDLLSHQRLAPRVQQERPLEPCHCRKARAFGAQVLRGVHARAGPSVRGVVLGMYHLLISRFKVEYFLRVTAVGYSCVVFGWMTILSVKQPSSKLDLFGFLSLPISFAPFESLVFTSFIVPQASFLGHLSGLIVGYTIAWGVIHGMNSYWAASMLGWTAVLFVYSLKRSGAYDFSFLEIESVTDPSLPSLRFVAPGDGRTLQMNAFPGGGGELV